MNLGEQVVTLVIVCSSSSIIGSILLSVALELNFFASDPNARIVLSDVFESILGFAGAASAFTVPIGVAFGVPAFFIFRRFNVLNWWSVSVLGALLGAAVSGTWVTSGFVPWQACVALGLVAAYIAWLLIVRSNLLLNSDAPPMMEQ